MGTPVISVDNLSKRYFVGHREGVRGENTDLRETVRREIRNFTRKAVDFARGRVVVQGDSIEEFWALKNVSFQVQQGEVLGIIGRNGAGKSTLLKVLSRITEPTSGRVMLRGRVASLLEVGTGFHPELSGRENIYLNGSILGMTRREISTKFDEIVAFAELDQFIDTPVKRYSSGMYVRLAFAVAAHLEPEILIVDEVLAVGDAEFQKKCLGKMEEVSHRNGRTVLFVSHNMGAIAELTNRVILLDRGSITADASVSEAFSAYLKGRHRGGYVNQNPKPCDLPYVLRAELVTSQPNGLQQFGEPLCIKVWIRHPKSLSQLYLGVQIVNSLQVAVAQVYAFPPESMFGQQPGTSLIEFQIPKVHLNVGHFNLKIWLTGGGAATSPIYEIIDCCDFDVARQDFFGFWSPQHCTYHERFFTTILHDESSSSGVLDDAEAVPG